MDQQDNNFEPVRTKKEEGPKYKPAINMKITRIYVILRDQGEGKEKGEQEEDKEAEKEDHNIIDYNQYYNGKLRTVKINISHGQNYTRSLLLPKLVVKIQAFSTLSILRH